MARTAQKCWLCPAGHSVPLTLPMGSAPHPTALEPPTPGSCSQWHQGAPRPHLLVPVLGAGGVCSCMGPRQHRALGGPCRKGTHWHPPSSHPARAVCGSGLHLGRGSRGTGLFAPNSKPSGSGRCSGETGAVPDRLPATRATGGVLQPAPLGHGRVPIQSRGGVLAAGFGLAGAPGERRGRSANLRSLGWNVDVLALAPDGERGLGSSRSRVAPNLGEGTIRCRGQA